MSTFDDIKAELDKLPRPYEIDSFTVADYDGTQNIYTVNWSGQYTNGTPAAGYFSMLDDSVDENLPSTFRSILNKIVRMETNKVESND